MEGTLMEIRRVVKPRGKILVFEPNKLNLLLWILCFLDPNERGLLSLGSRRSYRKLFSDHFVIEEMDYNGLLLGADSLLNRGLVNFLSIPIFKRLIGWQHPKIFMVVSLKG
jgi:SAM-dependent methyltransferase